MGMEYLIPALRDIWPLDAEHLENLIHQVALGWEKSGDLVCGGEGRILGFDQVRVRFQKASWKFVGCYRSGIGVVG